MSGYNFETNTVFFCLRIFLTFSNNVDTDEMQHYGMLHFIWVFTVCKSTHLGVSLKRWFNRLDLALKGMIHTFNR